MTAKSRVIDSVVAPPQVRHSFVELIDFGVVGHTVAALITHDG